MLTVNSLLDTAIAAEQLGDHRVSMEAMAAAEWMELRGVEQIAQIGNFGGQNLRKGDRVRIKKGTVIRSMHPRHSRDNPKVAGRDYVVTLHDVYNGYMPTHYHRHESRPFRNQQIVWPGEGGYWCHVDTSLVEIVS